MNDTIKAYEEKLRLAMMNSDFVELDKLISDDLIFVNHLGQIISKEDDLSSHKKGIVKLTKLNIISQNIRLTGNTARQTHE